MNKQSPSPVAQGAILAEIEIKGVNMIHGVTFDGTHVWFAGGPDQDIHCVDPKTGALVKRFGRTDCAAGLAFDGQHLWQNCGEEIHQIDRQTGKTVRAIPAPPGEHHSGLAWAAGHLWVGSFRGRKISKVDPKTGKVVRQIASDRLVTGVTWAGAELWHGTYPERDEDIEPGELRQIDPETGDVKRRLHVASGVRISGTEFDGKDRIWFGARSASKNVLQAVRKP